MSVFIFEDVNMKENFNRNYIVVAGWMLTDLDLKGNELLIYALIHGLGGTENQARLSYGYIAKMLHITRTQVVRILDKLVNDGYIERYISTLSGEKNDKNIYKIVKYQSETKLHHLIGQNYTTLKIKKINNKNTYTHIYNKRDIENMTKEEVIQLMEEYKLKYQALCEIAKVNWVND